MEGAAGRPPGTSARWPRGKPSGGWFPWGPEPVPGPLEHPPGDHSCPLGHFGLRGLPNKYIIRLKFLHTARQNSHLSVKKRRNFGAQKLQNFAKFRHFRPKFPVFPGPKIAPGGPKSGSQGVQNPGYRPTFGKIHIQNPFRIWHFKHFSISGGPVGVNWGYNL